MLTGIYPEGQPRDEANKWAQKDKFELEKLLTDLQFEKSNTYSPEFGNFVDYFGDQKMEEGIDFYISGFGGSYDPEPNRNAQGQIILPDTDIQTQYKDAQEGDIWTGKGLMRLDQSRFNEGDESDLVQIGNTKFEKGHLRAFMAGDIVKMSEPNPGNVKYNVDGGAEQLQKDREEWNNQQNKEAMIIEAVDYADDDVLSTHGKIVSTRIPAPAQGNDIRNISGGVMQTAGTVVRGGAKMEQVAKHKDRGIKLMAGVGEKTGHQTPINNSDFSACGDNMTCISSATGMQTMAAGSGEYDDYLVSQGYEPYGKDISAFSTGDNFNAANTRAWNYRGRSYLAGDPYWETIQNQNLEDLVEITGYEEKLDSDGNQIPIYDWIKGKQPNLGDILGLYGSGEYINHSGYVATNNQNLRSKKVDGGYRPRWYAEAAQDHTVSQAFTTDDPDLYGEYDGDSPHMFNISKYKGSPEYQAWLATQMPTYDAKIQAYDTDIAGIKRELETRDWTTDPSWYLGNYVDQAADAVEETSEGIFDSMIEGVEEGWDWLTDWD